MTFADGWVCRACWKSNRPHDPVCYRCRTPRDADEDAVVARRAATSARAEQPEAVPDIVVALPVVIFRGYSKAWLRGGLVTLGLLILIALGGVTDVGYLLLTGGIGAGLIVIGILAGETADAMRDREAWAFIVGVGRRSPAASAPFSPSTSWRRASSARRPSGGGVSSSSAVPASPPSRAS